MRTKTKNRFDTLKEKALGSTEETTVVKTSKRPSVLGKRQEAVAAVASGKVKTIKIFEHDPQRIRPWSGHNRHYDALSKERCSDLIEGFRRAGQQFPAIVRTVSDSDEYDFEFICGARRHWTAAYLKRDLVIEVRNIDDRDAFLLQDIENRDREDISDYERASDYSKALPVYFEGKKSHMAEQLQIDSGNFNRLLALVDLPSEIIDAYADIRDLVVHHGTQYAKYLKDPATKKWVLSAAKKLKGQGASGKEVVAALRQASRQGMPVDAGRKNMRSTNGSLSITRGKRGQYTVSFTVPSKDREQGIAAIRSDLQEMIDSLAEEADASRSKSAETDVTS